MITHAVRQRRQQLHAASSLAPALPSSISKVIRTRSATATRKQVSQSDTRSSAHDRNAAEMKKTESSPSPLPFMWGPNVWKLFHCITLKYPEHPTSFDKSVANRLFKSGIMSLLPCTECVRHYKQLLRTMPINVSSRQSLFVWFVSIHNAVNRKLSKHVIDVSDALILVRSFRCDRHFKTFLSSTAPHFVKQDVSYFLR